MTRLIGGRGFPGRFSPVPTQTGGGQAPTNVNALRKPTYTQPTVTATDRTLYSVSTAVSGSGTSTDPYTLAQVRTNARPGDTVYLAGDYGAGSYLAFSAKVGSTSSWMKFTQWPGRTQAIIRGSGDANDYVLYAANCRYIQFDGLQLIVGDQGNEKIQFSGSSNMVFTNLDCNPCQMQIGTAGNGATEVWVSGCTFDNSGSTVANSGDHIFVQSGTGALLTNDVIIYQNTFLKAGHAAMTVGSYQLPSHGTTSGVTVSDNTVQNPWAGGIDLNGKAQNCVVEHNRISNSGLSGYPKSAIATQEGIFLLGDSNTVRYNEISNITASGINMQSYTLSSFLQVCTRNKVYHNSIYSTRDAPIHWQLANSVTANFNANSHFTGNVVENNVYWGDGAGDLRTPENKYVMLDIDAYHADSLALSNTSWAWGDLGNNLVRNNMLARVTSSSASETFVRYVLNKASSPQYDAATFNSTYPEASANTEFVNPAYMSTTSYVLQAGSAAIDFGILAQSQAYAGDAPDAGAWEKA